METTEFTEFEPLRKLSRLNDIKAPMSTILIWQAASAQNKIKYEVMGSVSFRVISKESPITELK